MAMSAGGDAGALSSEINVTPMIDVLLVLLIIFMIVQMLSRAGLEIIIPPPDTQTVVVSANDQIVLELRDDGSNWINGQGPYPAANLDAAIHENFDARPAKLLFIKTGLQRKYIDLIEAVDISKGAGIQVFGFTPIEAY